jgi:hypothetical protein
MRNSHPERRSSPIVERGANAKSVLLISPRGLKTSGSARDDLSAFRRQEIISSRHDRRITAGTEVGFAIDSHIDTADVILLLLSPDFHRIRLMLCAGDEASPRAERRFGRKRPDIGSRFPLCPATGLAFAAARRNSAGQRASIPTHHYGCFLEFGPYGLKRVSAVGTRENARLCGTSLRLTRRSLFMTVMPGYT